MKRRVRLTEGDLHKIVKESVNSILNKRNPYNTNDLKQFVSDLYNMKRELYRYACDFESIDQETRQKLLSVGDQISSIRRSMFSETFPIPNGKLSPFDDEKEHTSTFIYDDDD